MKEWLLGVAPSPLPYRLLPFLIVRRQLCERVITGRSSESLSIQAASILNTSPTWLEGVITGRSSESLSATWPDNKLMFKTSMVPIWTWPNSKMSKTSMVPIWTWLNSLDCSGYWYYILCRAYFVLGSNVQNFQSSKKRLLVLLYFD